MGISFPIIIEMSNGSWFLRAISTNPSGIKIELGQTIQPPHKLIPEGHPTLPGDKHLIQ